MLSLHSIIALRPETTHCHSLISHGRRAVPVSCASGLGGFCSWSEKYSPAHIRNVWRDTGLRIVIPKSVSSPLLRLNPVATSPAGSSSRGHPGPIETSRQFSREQDVGQLGLAV